MHVAPLPDTCITHGNIEQHVFMQMSEFTVFKHNIPHTLIINYSQLPHKIISGTFKHIYITRIIKF